MASSSFFHARSGTAGGGAKKVCLKFFVTFESSFGTGEKPTHRLWASGTLAPGVVALSVADQARSIPTGLRIVAQGSEPWGGSRPQSESTRNGLRTWVALVRNSASR